MLTTEPQLCKRPPALELGQNCKGRQQSSSSARGRQLGLSQRSLIGLEPLVQFVAALSKGGNRVELSQGRRL